MHRQHIFHQHFLQQLHFYLWTFTQPLKCCTNCRQQDLSHIRVSQSSVFELLSYVGLVTSACPEPLNFPCSSTSLGSWQQSPALGSPRPSSSTLLHSRGEREVRASEPPRHGHPSAPSAAGTWAWKLHPLLWNGYILSLPFLLFVNVFLYSLGKGCASKHPRLIWRPLCFLDTLKLYLPNEFLNLHFREGGQQPLLFPPFLEKEKKVKLTQLRLKKGFTTVKQVYFHPVLN